MWYAYSTAAQKHIEIRYHSHYNALLRTISESYSEPENVTIEIKPRVDANSRLAELADRIRNNIDEEARAEAEEPTAKKPKKSLKVILGAVCQYTPCKVVNE